jgi:hypothetical protein
MSGRVRTAPEPHLSRERDRARGGALSTFMQSVTESAPALNSKIAGRTWRAPHAPTIMLVSWTASSTLESD